jgi:hypothetical protein
VRASGTYEKKEEEMKKTLQHSILQVEGFWWQCKWNSMKKDKGKRVRGEEERVLTTQHFLKKKAVQVEFNEKRSEEEKGGRRKREGERREKKQTLQHSIFSSRGAEGF